MISTVTMSIGPLFVHLPIISSHFYPRARDFNLLCRSVCRSVTTLDLSLFSGITAPTQWHAIVKPCIRPCLVINTVSKVREFSLRVQFLKRECKIVTQYRIKNDLFGHGQFQCSLQCNIRKGKNCKDLTISINLSQSMFP